MKPLPQTPSTITEEGRERLVGVEVEFADLGVNEAADVVQGLYGGRAEVISEYEVVIRDARWGDFRVEVDSSFLKRVGREPAENMLEEIGRVLVESVSGSIVPIEVASPPIAMSELAELDALGPALESKGARGTFESLFYAFGIHFNPELSSREIRSIVNQLRSFLLLSDYLTTKLKVDPSRRLSTFVAAFPDAYASLVLDPKYEPSRQQFTIDYVRHNPTRNRALDLLPLLAELELETLKQQPVDLGAVKARPTWHYRLPNSLIGNGGSILDDWWSWTLVEQLAADSASLQALSEDWHAHRSALFDGALDPRWRDICRNRLTSCGLLPI